MITVAECSSVDEALFLKSMLAGNAPHVMFAGTGVRVQVAEEDAETALDLIAIE
jgi:hypothetical protein